jgi:hypothetical protein
MNYPTDKNYHLRDITKEIEDGLEKEGRVYYFPVEASQAINKKMGEAMIQAKREHIKNQRLSRLESAKIIFNT